MKKAAAIFPPVLMTGLSAAPTEPAESAGEVSPPSEITDETAVSACDNMRYRQSLYLNE